MTSSELRAALKAAGESLAAIARRAGVPRTTVYSFASGDVAQLKADAHARLVAALGAEPAGSETASERGVREDQRPLDPGETVSVPVPVPPHLAQLAKEHGLDVPALLAEGGLAAIEAAGRKAWYEANREAIEAKRRHIEKYGTFAERHGVFPNRR